MKRRAISLLLTAILLLLLASCGSPAPAAEETAAPTGEATGEATGEPAATTAAEPTADPAYASLSFDADAAYQGEYTVEGDDYVPGALVFKTYQVTYCTNPYTDEWVVTDRNGTEVAASEFFKMNIKVPVSYDGTAFDEAALAAAPILFHNPWGGDNGSGVGAPDAVNNDLIRRALSEGWVVVEPGMRGSNCVSGTPGEAGYVNYGKLPNPIVDLKAAIRYLRYGTNAETIPGDKERIFAAGTSSGGCGTSMLAASGNTHLYDAELAQIGAAPGRDDVFCALPSCPVANRSWGDSAIAWEIWGDLSGDTGANEINAALCAAFPAYLDSFGLKASFAVGDSIAAGDALTADNYAEYLMTYVRASAVAYLNSLGSREAIDEYLTGTKAADMMYGTGETTREWIQPVYDDNGVVTDIGGTWDQYWQYVVGPDWYNSANLLNLQYDRPFNAPDDCMEENGMVNSGVGSGLFATNANASSYSFGKTGDYAGVFTVFGQDWIREKRDIAISQEYLDLIAYQRNSVDPLYFIVGEGAADATVCPNWCLRTGGVDLVTPLPLFFGMATALENAGVNVDAALVWDQGHGLTNDLDGVFDFADTLLANG